MSSRWMKACWHRENLKPRQIGTHQIQHGATQILAFYRKSYTVAPHLLVML